MFQLGGYQSLKTHFSKPYQNLSTFFLFFFFFGGGCIYFDTFQYFCRKQSRYDGQFQYFDMFEQILMQIPFVWHWSYTDTRQQRYLTPQMELCVKYHTIITAIFIYPWCHSETTVFPLWDDTPHYWPISHLAWKFLLIFVQPIWSINTALTSCHDIIIVPFV